jgi:hypothetical protein
MKLQETLINPKFRTDQVKIDWWKNGKQRFSL